MPLRRRAADRSRPGLIAWLVSGLGVVAWLVSGLGVVAWLALGTSGWDRPRSVGGGF